MSASTSEPAGSNSSCITDRREQLVHRLLPLPGSKAHQQGKRLGAAQRLARRPLRKRGAENLRSRTFGQQPDLKTIEHRISGLRQTQGRWSAFAPSTCAALPAPCRDGRFRCASFSAGGPRRLERFVGNHRERRIVLGLRAAVDIPMSVGHGMRLCPGGNRVQQGFQAVLGLDAIEICAVRPQFAKQWLVVCRHSLADYGNPQPRNWRFLRRRGRL